MSNNVLPNLSEWFEVPVGATIPANTLYAILYSDGHYTTKDNNPFRSEECRSWRADACGGVGRLFLPAR